MRKKTLAVMLTAAMTMASMAIPAMAADAYTPQAGTAFTFDKYLIMKEDANVPDMTFEFTITAGEAKEYTAGSKMAVYAGDDADKVTGAPSIAATTTPAGAEDADFDPGDTTYTSVQSGDTLTLDSGEKYAAKAVGVDFSSVEFKEPGVYRYVITETSADQQGITYDTQAATAGQKTRVLDVYVIDNNGALEVNKYVLHDSADDIDAAEGYGSDGEETKSTGFVNEYKTFNMTFSKTVTGNQASKDKFFKFTVELSNAPANTVYDVDVTNITAAPEKTAATVYTAAEMGEANAADGNTTLTGKQIVTDASGAATVDYYLQGGQSVVIKGLPDGAKYTVTEVQEDYKPSATSTGDDAAVASAGNSVSDTTTGIKADTTNAFTNTRSGNIPTGVAVAAGSGLAVLGIGLAGIFLTRKKED